MCVLCDSSLWNGEVRDLRTVSEILSLVFISFTFEHFSRQILDIKCPSSTCWDNAAPCQHKWNVLFFSFPRKTKLKTEGKKVKSHKLMTLMGNFLEAGQPVLHAFISYLLWRILLCQCVHASVRDDSVVWSELELLWTPCQASRSQRDLAHTPEMHDGWDRDVWCKLSHHSAGVYHIMRHQWRRNKR